MKNSILSPPKTPRCLFQPLLKPEHSIRELLIHFLPCIRIVWIRMVAVVELHDMKPAAVDIEMDIPLLKVRGDGFPDSHFRVQTLYSTPCSIADTLAVCFGRHKKQVEITAFSINFDDHTADRLAVLHDPVCLAAVDGLLDSFTGDNLAIFFEVVIKEAAEYSNIGINKIDSMLRSPNCPFVLYVGTKKLVKRKAFEQYISDKLVI